MHSSQKEIERHFNLSESQLNVDGLVILLDDLIFCRRRRKEEIPTNYFTRECFPLCILMWASSPRNKPNHISITKKMVLYVSCMHNIIYAAFFFGKQQNIFTKLVFMVNERKTRSYYGWDHHKQLFSLVLLIKGINFGRKTLGEQKTIEGAASPGL